jgi:glycosyltransferase involved in cell wall biosynthesis
MTKSRVVVYTSYKAISLKTVANHIAKVARYLGHDAEIRTSYEPAQLVKRQADSAIIVMTGDPLAASPWILFARDLTDVGVKNVYYGVVEGRLNPHHVAEWMTTVKFVAPSQYVATKMRAVGLNVVDVVPHGIDFTEVDEGERAVLKAVEYMKRFGLDPSKHIIALTIANAHPRKGLAWLDKVAEIVAKFTKPIRFFVITEPEGLKYFKNRDNLVVSTDFGKLPRELVLALIKASHMVLIPSFSEGFGLPALEAMAMGTPCVATELPPLKEFAKCWFVPYSHVSYFDRTPMGSGGIIFEQYIYEPDEFAAQVLNVADIIVNHREVLEAWRAMAMKEARKYSILSVYPKLVAMVT